MAQNTSLRGNIISLFLLQGANYVLPLITVPYLVRILGPEKFGLLAFSQAFIQYFVLLTDYGFNLSATRLISIHRDDLQQRSYIFWSTVWIKIGLMIISFLITVAVVFSFHKFRIEWPLFFITFMVVVGNVLFPIWYFQGMERMKFISAVNISAKLISVAAIFLLVHQEGDYLLAAACQAGGILVSGLLGMYFVPKAGPLLFLWPKPALLLEAFKEGWHLFISTAGVSLYSNSTTFILGLLAGVEAVGYFSASQKLITAFQGLTTPVSQAIYPRITALAVHSRQETLRFLRKTLTWIGTCTLLLSIIIFGFAKYAVLLILGPQFLDAVVLVRITAFIPFVVGLSNVFGIQTMIPFGMTKQFSRILVSGGIVNLLILFPLILVAGAKGAAISLLVTEITITLLMGWVLHINGLHIYRFQIRGKNEF
jgi:polysaccharide transporter, PST family